MKTQSRGTYSFVPFMLSSTLALSSSVALADSAPRPLPAFATTPSLAIDCQTTPFGRHVTVGQDVELVAQLRTSLKPWQGLVYNPNWQSVTTFPLNNSAALSGAAFMTSVVADLDGDGRDEIVSAYRLASTGFLYLTVTRGHAGATSGSTVVELIDSWTTNSKFVSVKLAAGDLDGTHDGKKEVAVLYNELAADGSDLILFTLRGNASGFTSADGVSIASARIANAQANFIAMSTGDVLLDGKDQIVIAMIKEASIGFSLNHYVMEQFSSVLPAQPGDTGIGRIELVPAGPMDSFLGTSVGVDNAYQLDVDVGDLTDTAAAEIVTHVGFLLSHGKQFYRIGRLLYHVETTRNASNQILSAEMVRDDSQLVQADSGSPLTFDATIGNIDGVSPNEIVIARAYEGAAQLRVEGFKVTTLPNGPPYVYRFVNTAAYAAGVPLADPSFESSNLLNFVHVAVGDMDADGIGDVMTAVRDVAIGGRDELRVSRWRLTDPGNPATFSETHAAPLVMTNAEGTIQAIETLAADIDGDSVFGEISADCRRVVEPMIRSLVWWPPYFTHLQSNSGNFQSSFGTSASGNNSNETHFGTYTSHDVSGYLGGSVGGAILGIGAEASVKATAGYNYQSSKGGLHGTQQGTATTEGFVQSQGDGLVVTEENTYNCYSYNIGRSTGMAGDSNVRMCEIIEGTRGISGTDSLNWNDNIAAANPAGPPLQWVPLNRDWASFSLFKPVTSNTSLSASSLAQLTDGLFNTNATSPATTNPYLQIDLGQVRDISNVRIFPRVGSEARLKGFVLFASDRPMVGSAMPSGPNVQAFASPLGAGYSYDRWNIWTRKPVAGGTQPIKARYLRLQNPNAAAKIDIAEIQAFGDTHVDPPNYPQAICDPVLNDGKYRAKVWDAGSSTFRLIDVRGDLLWDGTASDGACLNDTQLRRQEIWNSTVIGPSASNTWDLAQTSGQLTGTTTSLDSSTRVGAEFDVSGGFIADVQAGGAYEFTSGVTEDTQTTMYWETGLLVGGQAGGFVTPVANSVINNCKYYTQPYAYTMTERSNTGYLHRFYAVDYVVRGVAWSRGSVSLDCGDNDETVFHSGFE